MESAAPFLIHEETNIIKRALRDMYSRDMDEILVEGDEGYRAAKDLMKKLIPSHSKKVQPYKDSLVPIFRNRSFKATVITPCTPRLPSSVAVTTLTPSCSNMFT